MDFALTDDQRAIQDAARAFSDAELASLKPIDCA